MKKLYKTPKILVEYLNISDIILTSFNEKMDVVGIDQLWEEYHGNKKI